MYVFIFEFCNGRRRSHNCGMHTVDCTTSPVLKGTRLFVLLCEALVTGDPWFITTSQISSVIG